MKNKLIKPRAVQQELRNFLIPEENRDEYSRALLSDAFPWFIASRKLTVRGKVDIGELGKTFHFNGKEVTQIPAIFPDKKMARYAGEREAIVLRAVRKLMSERLESCTDEDLLKEGSRYTMAFSLNEIRRILNQFKHDLPTPYIHEALEVLARAQYFYKDEANNIEVMMEKRFTSYAKQGDKFVVVFGRAESEWIHKGKYRAVSYKWILQHKNNLANRLAEFLLIMFKNADKKGRGMDKPFVLNFEETCIICGLTAARIANNKPAIFTALTELLKSGFLREFNPNPFPTAKGKHVLKEIMVWLSDEAVESIIVANTEDSKRNSGHDNPQIALSFPPSAL